MHLHHRKYTWPGFILAVALWAAGSATAQTASPIADFTFLQFSDIHVTPVASDGDATAAVRGQETIDWLCTQAGRPQRMTCFDLTAPPPAFALATGDLTEFGVMDQTWAAFEHAVAKLPCRLYVLPGNHDNTWVAMYATMRQRHGGENYAFDHGGCHFICLSSASPQEPVPTLDAKTRAFLAADLARTPPATPIFLALHHPLDSGEFAQPAEQDTLVDLLRDHNIALILYGHGHNAVHRSFGGMDGIMGGSTFGKRSGYALVSIHDQRVRAAYFYDPAASEKKNADGEPTVAALLDKPLATTAPQRLFSIAEADAAGAVLPVTLAFAKNAAPAKITLRIDGQPIDCPADTDASTDRPRFNVPLADQTTGAHLLTVEATAGETTDWRTRSFHVDRPNVAVLWRRDFPAAFKAAPIVVEDRLIIAGNDGTVTALALSSGVAEWRFSAGAEILGTPAYAAGTLVFGAGDGKIYGLTATGEQRWVRNVGAPVYGGVLIHDGVAYVGDNGGRMHALAVADGSPRWTFNRANFSIESRPAIWRDLVVFGAWDGNLYAVAVADGTLRWKTPGPKASEGKAARYYAPADCGPIVVDDQLWVCDRGYELGHYSADGHLQSRDAAKISAIATASDQRTFFARAIDDRVLRIDAAGETLWQAALPAGRFPIPPTEHDGRLYVCSNTGLLSALDAETGKLLGQYHVTPGFYVMAPVTVHGAGGDNAPTCYAAGMDGTVAAVRFR